MTDSPSRAIPLSVVGVADTLQPGAKQLAGDKIGRSPVQFADAPVLLQALAANLGLQLRPADATMAA